MEIKSLKTKLALSIALVAFNSHATSESTDKNNKDNLQRETLSKSCVAIEREHSKKRRLRMGKERVDLFVQLDSFNSYNKGFEEKMKSLSPKDTMIYAFSSMGIIAVGMQTAFTPMLLGLCNEEMAAINQCNYEIPSADGGKLLIETQWENAKKYTMTQSLPTPNGSKIKKMIISSELPSYWNGDMTIYTDDGSKTKSTWSRTTDGTEHYHAEKIGGREYSSATFTESPNCSADVKYVKGDIKLTANWTLSGDKTTGTFTYCNLDDCHNGDW
ncbi:hypothetical protein ACOYR1_07365 [Thalassotalea piscium]